MTDLPIESVCFNDITTMAQWKSNDDFEIDLREFSEVSVSTEEELVGPPPPTIKQYNARMRQNTKSIFDTNDYFESFNGGDEEVTHVYSGRGRGCMTKIFVPGKPISQPVNDEEGIILRKIKEETGFIGHNEIFENKYKKMFVNADEPKSFTLQSVQPAQQQRDGRMSALAVNGSGTNSPVTNVESTDTPKSPQLPLSVIMQRAKKKREDVKLKSESDNSGSDSACAYSVKLSTQNGNSKLSSSTSSLSSVRSKTSDRQWRNFSATESSSDDSRTGVLDDVSFVDSVYLNGNFRRKKTFNVASDVDFPPLGP